MKLRVLGKEEIKFLSAYPAPVNVEDILDQTVLNTNDLEGVYDYLSNLKAPYGFIPSYFNYLSEDQVLDSSNFPVFDDPNLLTWSKPKSHGFYSS